MAESLAWTRDPFDRIIVGQAAIRNDLLLSKDETIRAHYNGGVW
jgi:PIN domain nuclease of toxin-antitoxin system